MSCARSFWLSSVGGTAERLLGFPLCFLSCSSLEPTACSSIASFVHNPPCFFTLYTLASTPLFPLATLFLSFFARHPFCPPTY